MRWMLAIVLVATPAFAGKRGKRGKPEPEPVPVQAPEPQVPPIEGLFAPLSLVTLGALPEGLANASAQGCAACHPATVHRWRSGPHGQAPSDAFLAALEAEGNPTCGTCHWPLASQQPLSFTPALAAPPPTTPAAGFDGTLRAEGVTCAACHIREGAIVAASPGPHAAPHPVRHGPELASGEVCRSCHQLERDGVALYDTYGEWSRSAYAAAEVGCLDCHGGAGPDGRGATDHQLVIDGMQPVSLLVELDGDRVVRGGDPLEVRLTLQNTGAGHHWPSGGPWSGARLDAALVLDTDDGPTRAAPFAVDLHRRFDDRWQIVEDTRLAAGTSQEHTWRPALPQDAPAGAWRLDITLTPTARGQVSGEPTVHFVLPLGSD